MTSVPISSSSRFCGVLLAAPLLLLLFLLQLHQRSVAISLRALAEEDLLYHAGFGRADRVLQEKRRRSAKRFSVNKGWSRGWGVLCSPPSSWQSWPWVGLQPPLCLRLSPAPEIKQLLQPSVIWSLCASQEQWGENMVNHRSKFRVHICAGISGKLK